jgi:dTDP-4-amino-4,6-dideoxygalactose transaminase
VSKRANITIANRESAPKRPLFPFLDLPAQYAGIRDQVLAAVTRVLERQSFILGPEVESLEQELAQTLGCDFCIACASGSDALLLALMGLGIGPGDEVITTPFTFVATASSIARLGARPVFVDICPDTYNIDAEKIEKAVTARTRAIIPVHLFGLAAEMEAILDLAKKHRLAVIEDAAQAIAAQYKGIRVGSLGEIGCFSFFPSKNLGGAGDGGLMTTNDPDLADRLRILRSHGSRSKYAYDVIGVNSRLDALQAAILRVKLPYLAEWTAARQRNAERYRTLFRECDLDHRVGPPAVPAGFVHVYHQFVVRATDRDSLREYLQSVGIPSEIYYPHPLHLQPAFAYLGHKPGDFPQAELASRQVLALPVYPELSEAQLQAVVRAIRDFYS